MANDCNKSAEVNGSQPFAEARGSATVYTLAWQQADLAALASAADEIAFARHHHQEREWDEVEHLMDECIKGLEEIKERMFMVRHKLIECESPNDQAERLPAKKL